MLNSNHLLLTSQILRKLFISYLNYKSVYNCSTIFFIFLLRRIRYECYEITTTKVAKRNAFYYDCYETKMLRGLRNKNTTSATTPIDKLYFSAFTCKDLKKLADILPPPKTSRGRRERNLRSFADFMAMWMTFLSHLVAVAICARILSATADHVTAGRTRRWLFGYETRALGEPWPDVLGVTVVMVVCAMFMCGLEVSSFYDATSSLVN